MTMKQICQLWKYHDPTDDKMVNIPDLACIVYNVYYKLWQNGDKSKSSFKNSNTFVNFENMTQTVDGVERKIER